MIGNDIVDLALAKQESNWRRRGYLDKIFTSHEQQLIQEAIDPDQMVWLLWSMKESAYKRAVWRTQNRVFAPSKIACHLTASTPESTKGVVLYSGTHCTTSIHTPRYISTVAYASDAVYSPPKQYIFPFETADYQTHHSKIRQKIKQHISELINTHEDNVHIAKDGIGAPLLTICQSITVPLSISHHGFYGAFAVGENSLSPVGVV